MDLHAQSTPYADTAIRNYIYNIVGSPTLASLNDTIINTPTANQVLVFDGAQWVNETAPLDVEELANAAISNPQPNQALIWDGTKWVNGSPNAANIPPAATDTIEAGNTAPATSQGVHTALQAYVPISTTQQRIGFDTTSAPNSVVIGNGAKMNGQRTVLIGPFSGGTVTAFETSDCVLIGNSAGRFGSRTGAVAIGHNSGDSAKLGQFATALGRSTTATATDSVAIGNSARSTNTNAVVINGTGANLSSAQNSALYIAPIRGLAPGSITDGTNHSLYYNPTSKEIVYKTPRLLTWTSALTSSPGVFTITHDDAGTSFPAISVTPRYLSGTSALSTSVDRTSATTFVVRLYDAAGALTNGQGFLFSFISRGEVKFSGHVGGAGAPLIES